MADSADKCRAGGFTSIELLVVLAIISVFLSMAVLNLKELEAPEVSAASHLGALVKRARGKALASTLAYTVRPVNSSQIIAEYGYSCDDSAPVQDSSMTLDLPNGVTLSDTSWSICFSPRGISQESAVISVNSSGNSKVVSVAAGGGVKIE